MSFTVIIPARFGSQRLPGKALLDIAGKTMVRRVYEQACLSNAEQVIVATDDERIAKSITDFGGRVVMTREDHPSGTDRLQEVVSKLGLADDAVVVNVQGDEPLIPPEVINQVALNLQNADVPMATLYEVIDNQKDLLDPNIVKLVADQNDIALYFSRAPIPFARDSLAKTEEGSLLPSGVTYKRHLGLYAYRSKLLNEFVTWPVDSVENSEKLEQLRVLRQGIQIHVAEAVTSIPPGIDTEADLIRTRAVFQADGIE